MDSHLWPLSDYRRSKRHRTLNRDVYVFSANLDLNKLMQEKGYDVEELQEALDQIRGKGKPITIKLKRLED